MVSKTIPFLGGVLMTINFLTFWAIPIAGYYCYYYNMIVVIVIIFTFIIMIINDRYGNDMEILI